MKIVIVSDNHGQELTLKRIFDHYAGSDVTFVHTGDSEFPYQDARLSHCIRVTGNCDYDMEYPRFEVFTVEGITFFVTHGHFEYVNTGREYLADAAKEKGASVALYGHTHKLNAENVNGVLCINSGSTNYPRGSYEGTPSYAVLDILSNEKLRLTYYTTKHEVLDGLVLDYTWTNEGGFTLDS